MPPHLHPLHQASLWLGEFRDEFGYYGAACVPLLVVAWWVRRSLERGLALDGRPASDGGGLPARVWTMAAVAAPVFWLGSVWLAVRRPEFFDRLTEEDNWIENLQFAVLLVGAGLAARIAGRLRGKPFRGARLWAGGYAGLALGIFWAAGEEISWGQRIFHVATPGWFRAHNAQQEINLHNLGQVDGTLSNLTDLALAVAALIAGAVWVARLRRWAAARTALWAPHPALIPSLACALGYGWILGVYEVAGIAPPAAVTQLQESRELILYVATTLFLWSAWRAVNVPAADGARRRTRPAAEPVLAPAVATNSRSNSGAGRG